MLDRGPPAFTTSHASLPFHGEAQRKRRNSLASNGLASLAPSLPSPEKQKREAPVAFAPGLNPEPRQETKTPRRFSARAKTARPTGLEPATTGSTVRYSNQ